jgi:hypothetical protein
MYDVKKWTFIQWNIFGIDETHDGRLPPIHVVKRGDRNSSIADGIIL